MRNGPEPSRHRGRPGLPRVKSEPPGFRGGWTAGRGTLTIGKDAGSGGRRDVEQRAWDFREVGRLPAPGDNVAMATRRLEEGEDLLSWGLRFGRALKDIAPGDYACNAKILKVLAERHLGFDLPPEPNFSDAELDPYVLDEEGFRPGEQVPLYEEPRTFTGYRRGRGRGVGTRNYVVMMGVTSRLTGFVRALELEMNGVADTYDDVDGIVCVAHTEGGEDRTPNNLDLLLRTLSGFMVNPNVGAVLSLDHGGQEAVTNEMLRSYLENNNYPIEDVPHAFMSLEGNFRADLERAKSVVSGWLEEVNGARRTEEPVSELKIGLQCGGSDAFSGVSANPLVGWVSKEIMRNGGAANLA